MVFKYKVAIFSEANYGSKEAFKQPKQNIDLTWHICLDADPYCFYTETKLEQLNNHDIIIINYPKEREEVIEKVFASTLGMKQRWPNKKIGLIQHGGYDYFMNWSAKLQAQFITLIRSLDFFIATNENDVNFYKGLFPEGNIIYFKTPIDIELIDSLKNEEKEDRVYVGGNMTPWYAGTASLLMADRLGIPISMPGMGKRQKDENVIKAILNNELTINDYQPWHEWVQCLSKHKYAIHMMPVAGCGSFHVTCAVLGIPCIGRKHVSTQEKCFPKLCVDETFSNIQEVLNEIQNNYEELSKYARKKAEEEFSFKAIRKFMENEFDGLYK